MSSGDHLRVNRGPYCHHGVDCGDGTVVHFAGEPLNTTSAIVIRTSLKDFSCGGVVEVVEEPKAYSPDHVVKRAESRLGYPGQPGFSTYDVISNNCEHFARWCCSGVGTSRQVKNVMSVFGKVAAGVFGIFLLKRLP